MKRFAFLLLTLSLIPGLAQAQLMADGAVVRMPPPVADTAAGYVTLNNHSDKDVVLVDASSPVADSTEFHGSTMMDGMMHMNEMEEVVVPAHGKVEFGPGGNHIMLIGLRQELEAGQMVPITVKLSDGGTLALEAKVKDMRGGGSKHGHGGKAKGMGHGKGHGAMH